MRRPSQTIAAAGANGGDDGERSGGGAARSSSSYDNGDERRDLWRGGRAFSRFLAQLERVDEWEEKGLEHHRRVAGGAWSGIAVLLGRITLGTPLLLQPQAARRCFAMIIVWFCVNTIGVRDG